MAQTTKSIIWDTGYCPACGSPRTNHSHSRGYERLLKWFVRPYRCRDCKVRYWRLPNRAGTVFIILFWLLLLTLLAFLIWYVRHLDPPPPPSLPVE